MGYLTLGERVVFATEPVKGSRFVATVAPCAEEAQAMAVVKEAEASGDPACWAWRLRDGRTRVWDGDEPRGSAGRPILLQLEGHDVVDAVAVVTRAYGGVKLGVGGLMRAFGGAAGMALDRATLVRVEPTVDLVVAYAWADTPAVEAALALVGAARLHAAYDEGVTLVVRVEEPLVDALTVALRDRTAGRVAPRPAGT